MRRRISRGRLFYSTELRAAGRRQQPPPHGGSQEVVAWLHLSHPVAARPPPEPDAAPKPSTRGQTEPFKELLPARLGPCSRTARRRVSQSGCTKGREIPSAASPCCRLKAGARRKAAARRHPRASPWWPLGGGTGRRGTELTLRSSSPKQAARQANPGESQFALIAS